MDLNDYYAGGGAFNPTDTEYRALVCGWLFSW